MTTNEDEVQRVQRALAQKIMMKTSGLVWMGESAARKAFSFKALGLDSQVELQLAASAWRSTNVLGNPEAPVDGENLQNERARLLRNLEAWCAKKRAPRRLLKPSEQGSSSTTSSLEPAHASRAASPAASPPAERAAEPALDAAAAGAGSGAGCDAVVVCAGANADAARRGAPQTMLPTMCLNERVAKVLAALTLEDLIGADFLQNLKSHHGLPDSALAALQQRWTGVAAVQGLGAAHEHETYYNKIAAIFQSYMVALLHSGLSCSHLQAEQERRKAEAEHRKAKSKIKPIKLRPVVGGRYDLRLEHGA